MRRRRLLRAAGPMATGRLALFAGLLGGGLFGGMLGLYVAVLLACWGMAGGDYYSGPSPDAVDNLLTALRWTAYGVVAGAIPTGVLCWAVGVLVGILFGDDPGSGEG